MTMRPPYASMAGGPVGPADPMQYSSMAGSGVGRAAPAGVSPGSSWRGTAGMAMQAGGDVIAGIAAIRQADSAIDAARDDLVMTSAAIYDTYNQIFEDMADQNRRLFAAQDVAVATSGVAVEGSVVAVLNEAVEMAQKQRKRVQGRMQGELNVAAYQARQRRKSAEENKKWATISTGLKLAGTMGGYS